MANSSCPLSGVWGSGPTDVYAVSPLSQVLHYDGDRWKDLPISPAWSIDIWGSGSDDVYILDLYDGLHHFDGSRLAAHKART